MKREVFRNAEEALKRGEWLTRQSKNLNDSGSEAIRKSREMLKTALEVEPKYKGPEE